MNRARPIVELASSISQMQMVGGRVLTLAINEAGFTCVTCSCVDLFNFTMIAFLLNTAWLERQFIFRRVAASLQSINDHSATVPHQTQNNQ